MRELMADRSLSPVMIGSLLIGLPLLLLVIWTTDWSQAWDILRTYEAVYLLWFAGFAVANLACYTLVWAWFLALEGERLSWTRMWNYRMAGGAVSYVTPGPRIGGELTRADLFSEHGSWRVGLSTSVGEKVVLFLSGLVFDTFVVLSVISGVLAALYNGTVLITALSVVALIGAGVIVARSVSEQGVLRRLVNVVVPESIGEQVGNVKEDVWRYVTSYPWIVGLAVVFGIGSKMLIAAQFYALVLGAGFHVSFWEACVLAAALDIAYSIPSYMGLGSLEGGQALATSLVGLSSSVGVIIAVLARVRDLVMSGYGILFLIWRGGVKALFEQF